MEFVRLDPVLATFSAPEGGSTWRCKASELAAISLPARGAIETMVVVENGPKTERILRVHEEVLCQSRQRLTIIVKPGFVNILFPRSVPARAVQSASRL